MTAMVTFSWIGIMLLVGVVLRAVIKPLGNILMPASVIGGIVGVIMMNIPDCWRIYDDSDIRYRFICIISTAIAAQNSTPGRFNRAIFFINFF